MKHLVIAAILVVVVTALVILGLNAFDLVPQLASEEGAFVDQMFQAQIYVIAFIFSLIMVLMLYSVVVFRRKPGDESEGPNIKGNTGGSLTADPPRRLHRSSWMPGTPWRTRGAEGGV